jgi:iron complex outermembrane receptor protein
VHQHASPGVRGFVNGTGGSNNGLAGGAAGFEIGAGNWQMWASGGGQRTGNYRAASHEVLNSQSRMQQTQAGVGYYGDRAFANFNYGFTDSRYGVPYDLNEVNAEIPELALRRHNYRGTFGLRNVGFLDSVTAKINHSDYKHQELIEGQVETEFFNKLTAYRVQFDQKKKGRWSGSFGFQGAHRNYNVVGAEALVPPVTQNTAAVFGVQNFDFESGLRVQLGGRVEHNAYDPIGLVKRSFTGFSGSAGVSQRLWTGGALALNYSHAYRAPALEELYNHGPHPGNALFEVGDPNLKREQNNGIDASLRHQSSRLRAEFNVFFYHLRDFVFFSPTGEVEDGLPVANYAQGTSKYRGLEGKFDVALHNSLWLNLGVDAVNARLTAEDMPLPRIPPVRGRVGVEFRHAGFSLKPEVQLAQAQTGVFFDETPTAGYAVANVQASYTHADAHRLQVFSVNVFNAGDTLYRNHLSLLKSFAPEIGRGVRFSYSLQVF